MGSFEGHILPGSFFMCFGVWWTYAMCRRYMRVLRNKDARYVCTATYQSNCWPNTPIEGFCKIIASIIGMIAEAVTAMENGKFTHIGNAQHITMFLFYGINGVVDVLLFYGFPLPADSDYMTMAFATAIEGILFIFHLHGRTPLDVQVHTLLIVAITCSLVSIFIEWIYRHNILSSFFRTFCLLLQSTWFYQIGFTLYPPFAGSLKPDYYSHRELMLITAAFCWHIAAIIFFISFVGFSFYISYRSLIVNEDNSIGRHLPNSYPDIKYRKFDEDLSLNLVTNDSKNTNGMVNLLNNNLKQSKYAIDESGEEVL